MPLGWSPNHRMLVLPNQVSLSTMKMVVAVVMMMFEFNSLAALSEKGVHKEASQRSHSVLGLMRANREEVGARIPRVLPPESRV